VWGGGSSTHSGGPSVFGQLLEPLLLAPQQTPGLNEKNGEGKALMDGEGEKDRSDKVTDGGQEREREGERGAESCVMEAQVTMTLCHRFMETFLSPLHLFTFSSHTSHDFSTKSVRHSVFISLKCLENLAWRLLWGTMSC